MSDTSFTFNDAEELERLMPLLELEARRDAAQIFYFEKEAARRRGVGFSGSAPLIPPQPRSDSQRLQAAREVYARMNRPQIASRRKLLYALAELEQIGHGRAAQRVRGFYDRQLADPSVAVDAVATGRAMLEILALVADELAVAHVCDAVSALAEMLIEGGAL